MININHIYYIPGLKGLYGVLNTVNAGIIVCNLQTGQRVTVFNSQKIGCLGAMTIETKSETVEVKTGKILLPAVFNKMKTVGSTIDANAEPQELHNYFRTIVPDYDQKLIHTSDISRIIKWFNILDPVVDFSNVAENA